MKYLFSLFLALSATFLNGQCLSFANGGDIAVAPGGSFVDYSGHLNITSGIYMFQLTRTGNFTTNNLQFSVNGITVAPNGYFQTSGNNVSFTVSGWLPGNASGYEKVVFTFYNILGQQVCSLNAYYIFAVPQTPSTGWTQVYTETGGGGLPAYEKLHPGDFDGDGDEDLLAVDGDWMTIFSFNGTQWLWGWSNNGDPNAGNGIYPYRNSLIVGDFNGDGKDEVMGGCTSAPSWMTIFSFANGNWQWGWSNYGNTNAGGGIYPYRSRLIPGDYDGDGKDEVMGIGSGNNWRTMFHFDNNDWQWGWSNYGNASHAITPYTTLVAGDFDADGKDELLGLSTWATTFNFDNNDWQWGWSTNGANNFAGWTYPFTQNEVVFSANIDNTDPAREEIMIVQRGINATKAGTFDFTGAPNANWSNSANPAMIGNWFMRSTLTATKEYRFVKATANQPAYLLARRRNGTDFNVSMYRTTPGNNYKLVDTDELEASSAKVAVSPNPCSDRLSLQLDGFEAGDIQIELLDMQGRLAQRWETTNPSDNSYTVQLSLDGDVPTGVYACRVSSKTHSVTKKIQKL